ncbi:Rrf2 family transcriptional regulator [Aliihoeflea sp. PC F10.4]
MKLDTRLSSILHLVLHMAEARGPLTSEKMAQMLSTNPVVVRRTMAGLRQAGLVRSEKGHGGGWVLERKLDEITLADIHAALGHPALLAFGNRNDNPQCLVEQAVNRRMAATMDDVQALVMQRLAAVTLADIRSDFEHKLKDHHHVHDHS